MTSIGLGIITKGNTTFPGKGRLMKPIVTSVKITKKKALNKAKAELSAFFTVHKGTTKKQTKESVKKEKKLLQKEGIMLFYSGSSQQI